MTDHDDSDFRERFDIAATYIIQALVAMVCGVALRVLIRGLYS